MSGRFQWLNFEYADPEKNFDRSQVKGVAARLITVKDPKFYQALDTAGGGKVRKRDWKMQSSPPPPAHLIKMLHQSFSSVKEEIKIK